MISVKSKTGELFVVSKKYLNEHDDTLTIVKPKKSKKHA